MYKRTQAATQQRRLAPPTLMRSVSAAANTLPASGARMALCRLQGGQA